jgi:peptidoglycan/LPS O-acetylase OafA/YrhL
MTEQTSRLPAVDGLRGLAILLVIYQHSMATAVGQLVVARTGWGFPYLVANAWMGVGLFFVLSGFVLALPYFSGRRSMTSWRHVSGFLAHRAQRLLPLFVFMAFVSLAFAIATGKPGWRSFAMTLTTASMFTRQEFFPGINGPFWSLSVEIWFSALFPLLLFSVARHGMAKTFIGALLVGFVVRCFGAYFEFENIHVNPVKDFVLARTDDFAVGMLIAWMYARGRLPRSNPVALIVFGLAVLTLTALIWDLRVQGLVPRAVTAGLNNAAQLGFAAILMACLTSDGVARLVSVWPLRILGVMCFSVYCWHGLLITPALRSNPFSAVQQLQFWALLLPLSALTFRFVEFPRSPLLSLFLGTAPTSRAPAIQTGPSQRRS